MPRVWRLPVATRSEVSDLVVGWLRQYPSHWTRTRYRRDLGHFAGWVQAHRGRGLLDVRSEDVLAYARILAGRRYGLDHRVHPLRRHNTIATQATAWSSFYASCVRRGALASNPVQQARTMDTAATYPPHGHNRPTRLEAHAVRAIVVEAHRDPWLGGTLGAALVGLIVATGWRPERITTRQVLDVLGRFDRATGQWVICCGEDTRPLPEVVHDYLEGWLDERPIGHGPALFLDRTGVRTVTGVDAMRLVNRCASRAGYGDTVTATQLGRAARELASSGIPVDLPALADLRRTAAAPQQVPLPDSPSGYDQEVADGQQSLIPLPDNVVPMRRGRRRSRRAHAG